MNSNPTGINASPSAKEGETFGRDNGGFTLVEVMVSSLLLTLFLAAAWQTLVMTTRGTRMVRQRTDAVSLAWSRIERARDMTFEEIDNLAEDLPGVRINEAGLPDENGDFLRSTVIVTESNALVSKRIRVGVLPRRPGTGEFTGQPETVETIVTNIERLGGGR